MAHRIERVQEEIKKIISETIQKGVKDPRMGFVSITAVEVNKDITFAKVFYSVYGNEETQKNSTIALESAKKYIRGEVGKNLKVRFTPELAFFMDKSMEYGSHIQGIINKLNVSDGDSIGERATEEDNSEN